MDELDAAVLEKLEKDSAFQESLQAIPEEERESVISQKKAELLKEEVSSLKEKAEKADKLEQIANDQKIRAEKAEALAKERKEEGLTPKDTFAMIDAKISSEDFDEVVRLSKVLGKTIPDTLKDKTAVSILNERIEERRTANATNTKGGQRGSAEVSGEDLLHIAETTGEVPDDEEGMRKLFLARQQRKIRK